MADETIPTQPAGEAAIFGDAALVPPVQPGGQIGVAPAVVAPIVETPIVSENTVPAQIPVVTEVGTAPVVEETQVFGGEAETIQQQVAPEQTVNVPLSVLQQMQDSIRELQAASAGEAVFDPLNQADKKKLINVGFYTLNSEDGTSKTYLVSGYKERVSQTGEREFVYTDGFDKNNNPILKALVELTDTETGDTITVEVVWDVFIKMVRAVQKEALRTNERVVDMTPAEEVVEVTSYQESGGYVKRNGSGVLVRASVKGVVHTYVVEINGKQFTINSDVVNIKV